MAGAVWLGTGMVQAKEDPDHPALDVRREG